MRLLNTTARQLETFYGKHIPKYAILSHMWGREEDEVLFNHIMGSDDDRREGERRRGYAKITRACKQALEDGWNYIWIDTCCINRESSTELSEAINSMYRWYQKSEVCYVYLEDVLGGKPCVQDTPSDAVQGDKGHEDSLFEIVPFEHSRWFSRGWTLQELIAPQYVVFYSNDWVDIGTKSSLRDTISAVTRIRIEMLMAYNPEEASVAERMSWAAFRETTRDEDIAYCLMGLFGVNMPLLYGEGDKAFRRLQEEIMKVSDDHSLFAWKARFNDRDVYQIKRMPLLCDNDYVHGSRGILADSPYNFRDGANIVRSKDGAYSPYSMTNQGLQIELPLQSIDPKQDLTYLAPHFCNNVFKATLKCTTRNKGSTRWIVIYLKMVKEGHYTRVLSHWLDETETDPNERQIYELTSLLVLQLGTYTTQHSAILQDVQVVVLPTESGFTVDGCDLVDYSHMKVTTLKNQDKCFAVVIGFYNGIPWLDVIDDIEQWSYYYSAPGIWRDEILKSYTKGGSRYTAVLRHLDRLSVRIPGNWSLVVSVGKIGSSGSNRPCFRATISIQRTRHDPSLMPIGDCFDGHFLGDLDHHNVHPDFKKERNDWFSVFNPRLERTVDISLLHSFMHEGIVTCIRFSRDGKYLATGCSTETRVYDTNSGTETCVLFNIPTVKDWVSRIYSLCFSPDHRLLATGGTDGQITLWDIHKKSIHKTFNGHQFIATSLDFSIDGRFVVSGSFDGTVRIWEIDDGTSRVVAMGDPKSRNSNANVLCVAISLNSGLFAAGSSSGAIRIWNMATTQLLKELNGHKDKVWGIAFTQDEKGLVSGSSDKTVKYWDVSGLTHAKVKGVVEVLSDSGVSDVPAWGDEKKTSQCTIGYKDSILSVAVTHDGRWVLSGSYDHRVYFCDLKNATAQFMLQGHTEPVSSVDVSPVGNMFATGSSDGRVRIWLYDSV